MATWSFPNFLDAWKAALDARAGLDGVTVFTAPPGEVPDAETIVLYDAEANQDQALMGPTNDERFTVKGVIRVAKPGAGEDITKSARDRVEAIFAEVEAAVTSDTTVAATVHNAWISSWKCTQGHGANDDFPTRVCQLEFGVTALKML